MGKKKEKTCLGRSLIKDKYGNRHSSKNSLRHTSEMQDGQDYNRIDFTSITEQTDLENFLSTAELAGTDFKAEKMNIKFVRPSSTIGIISKEEKTKFKLLHEQHKNLLRIPRRPLWDRSMNAEELAEAERESFLEWRRSLNQLQETDGIIMTPYEKNLEFWRQLWRVIERSDVVVQIVDGRNPLLFYCEDLTKYVKELNPNKQNLLLVNKADFLNDFQREKWADYFERMEIDAVFFSATSESALDRVEEESSDDESYYSASEDLDAAERLESINITDNNSLHDSETEDEDFDDESVANDLLHHNDADSPSDSPEDSALPSQKVIQPEIRHSFKSNFINSSRLLSREELIEVFSSYNNGPKCNADYVTIGLVGYPNVGKSSTINGLLQEKKVSVSATPGKTKHFQTLFLRNDVLLCDCPGLVFPAFVCTKEEMIISGILPIDQMRDHVPPTNLVLSLIPRSVLEAVYGVSIPRPLEGEDPHRCPISEEFLTVYGHMRGFMTHKGIPDHPRSARYILKDYLTGKLLYCHAPPGQSQEEYHTFTVSKVRKIPLQPTPRQLSILPRKKDIDKSFFNQNTSGVHTKGVAGLRSKAITALKEDGSIAKPWRLVSKRNTRQKARIKYAHLDI